MKISLRFFILILIFWSCKSKTAKVSELSLDDQAFYSSYINAYPSGIKSKNAAIRVSLANPLADVDASSRNASFFDIRPKVDGSLIWLDNQSFEFQPHSSFESDQHYVVSLDLVKIFPDIDKAKSIFTFDFQTRKLIVQLDEATVHAYDDRDPSKLHVEGTLHASDDVLLTSVLQSLSATQDGKTLEISWLDGDSPNTFNYTVKDVRRGDVVSEVRLMLDGKTLGSSSKQELSVTIHPLNVFEVLSVDANESVDQEIEVVFTDHLDDQQSMTGLVRLDNGAELRVRVDDNRLKITPINRQEGDTEIILDKSIQNSLGIKLQKDARYNVSFKKLTPQLQAVSTGVIMPGSGKGLVFPFRSVSLHAVQVRVIQIFEDNIGQFLQSNSLDQSYQLKRVGRLIHKSNISLGDPKDKGLQRWNDYAVDLSELIETEPGALYRVKISFGKGHAIAGCGNESSADLPNINPNLDAEFRADDQVSGYYDDDEYYESYWLEDQGDPCEDNYYQIGNPNSRPIYQNVMASDIGLIAKKSLNNKLLIAASNLLSTEPLANVNLTFYNLQNQIIQSATTDQSGFAELSLEGIPFYVIASSGNQKGYLKLDDGSSLSLSTFDVSGEKMQNGLKGFLYQERGVSRPGDSLYVTFVFEDKANPLPSDHPIIFELYDPRNQMAERRVVSEGVNNFYTFKTATVADAPTGNWLVKAKVGATSFSKTVKVETVKPNRLKINLDFEGDIIMAGAEEEAILGVKWLHGAIAKGIKSDVEMTLSNTNTTFEGYDGYSFDDQSKDFESDIQIIFDGRLNAAGEAKVKPEIGVKNEAPGMLRAAFKIRAFEDGGNFSVDRFSKTVSPFRHYVGVKVPEGPGWNGAIFSDEATSFDIVTVDQNGQPVSRQDLKVEVFNLRWNWWWERSSRNNIRNYVANRSENLLQSHVLSTNSQGKATYSFNLNEERWGKTLVRVTDPNSGHSTSQIFYTTYSRWWDDGGDDIPGGAQMLTFKMDKSDYNVGENIKVDIPSGKGGKVLISIENGTQVLQHFWMDLQETDGKVMIPASPEMAPNAYVHVTYIQPHGQVENGRPIRLFGVQRVNVSDPETKLSPTLAGPKEIRPNSDYELTVAEDNGKAMTYTLAVVDDGLLDLTRFATPDPWNTFYARQALGVKTWDLYDQVMGAYGGTLTQMLALGGDEFESGKEPQKANRFKPVVKFVGPFNLKRGARAKHKLNMGNYVGSVRAMVVAGEPDRGAYGNGQLTIPVKQPLMVATTLPRVLSPEESLDVPITVFAMDDKIKNVKVTVESNTLLQFHQKTTTVQFDEIGEKVVRLPVRVMNEVGIAKVMVTLEGGGEKTSEEIELDIRLPNPSITRVVHSSIVTDASSNLQYNYFGVNGTNEGMLELSTIPPLNLEKRLKYLIRFPHGCVEQTTSAAFPQLYLADLADVTNMQKDKSRTNVEKAIQKLRRFQNSSGGFSYWPGNRSSDDWGSSYAGHFLLEAKEKGHVVPFGMLEQWIRYQTTAARNWSPGQNTYWSRRSSRLAQSYRLFTLALADKPDLGAMNRLRGEDSLEEIVKWQLAGAYALAGKEEVARTILASASSDIKPYKEMAYTYGSDTRDRAFILLTYALIKDRTKGMEMIKSIAERLASDRWYSTQTTAVSLMAISKFMDGQEGKGPVNVDLDFGNGQKTNFEMTRPIKLVELPGDMGNQQLSISSSSGKELFARLVLSGVPPAGEEVNTSSNLEVKVSYLDLEGKRLNLAAIPQGSDINAQVTISHTGLNYEDYHQMALNQIFPAGWEIRNTRLDESEANGGGNQFDYQDVRDDRVMTYFSLPRRTSKQFNIQLNASYAGQFYLPAVQCEAMYDNTVSASQKGQWINVVPE